MVAGKKFTLLEKYHSPDVYSNRILIESFRKEVDEEPRSQRGLSNWVLSLQMR